MIGVPTSTVVALLGEQRGHGAGERRRQLDQRLRGLDLDQHLVDRDGVAGLDLPRDDLGLGQTLAHIRQRELGLRHGRLLSKPGSVRQRAVDGLEHAVGVGQVDAPRAWQAGTGCRIR